MSASLYSRSPVNIKAQLSAEALYALIHLTSLGGSDQWYRLSALGCQNELGNSTIGAIDELCHVGNPNPKVTAEESHYPISNESSSEGGPSLAGPSSTLPVQPDLSFLCEDELSIEPEGLLDYLTMPELRALAKDKQIKSTGLTVRYFYDFPFELTDTHSYSVPHLSQLSLAISSRKTPLISPPKRKGRQRRNLVKEDIRLHSHFYL